MCLLETRFFKFHFGIRIITLPLFYCYYHTTHSPSVTLIYMGTKRDFCRDYIVLLSIQSLCIIVFFSMLMLILFFFFFPAWISTFLFFICFFRCRPQLHFIRSDDKCSLVKLKDDIRIHFVCSTLISTSTTYFSYPFNWWGRRKIPALETSKKKVTPLI